MVAARVAAVRAHFGGPQRRHERRDRRRRSFARIAPLNPGAKRLLELRLRAGTLSARGLDAYPTRRAHARRPRGREACIERRRRRHRTRAARRLRGAAGARDDERRARRGAAVRRSIRRRSTTTPIRPRPCTSAATRARSSRDASRSSARATAPRTAATSLVGSAPSSTEAGVGGGLRSGDRHRRRRPRGRARLPAANRSASWRSGLDVVYPRRHVALWERVGRIGLCSSREAPPARRPNSGGSRSATGSSPRSSEIVIVVESSPKGGSMHTVDAALERGIDVMAVPGPVGARPRWHQPTAGRRRPAGLLGADDVLIWRSASIDSRRDLLDVTPATPTWRCRRRRVRCSTSSTSSPRPTDRLIARRPASTRGDVSWRLQELAAARPGRRRGRVVEPHA